MEPWDVDRATTRQSFVKHGLTARVLAEPGHEYARQLPDPAPRPGWRPGKTVA
jgi:hypothetical protein